MQATHAQSDCEVSLHVDVGTIFFERALELREIPLSQVLGAAYRSARFMLDRGMVEPGLKAASDMYERRVRHYFKLDVRELAPAGKAGADPSTVREAEAGSLMAALPADCDVVALTRKGKGMSSRRLAVYLEELGTYGHSGVAFVIGGAEGLADRVLDSARYRLTLSPMTLSHELARVVLLEQLYRAGTIIRREPYHRGP